MNVIVCVKQIPDPALPGALDPATNTLKRDGKLILDESDSYGVEMALQLADTAGGGEVTLVSMAPNSEASGLMDGLFVLLSDPSRPAEGLLPSTGVSQDWERLLSSAFIGSDDYGTRSSTVILVGRDGSLVFVERSFGPGGAAGPEVRFEVAGVRR